jgi:protein TonB
MAAPPAPVAAAVPATAGRRPASGGAESPATVIATAAAGASTNTSTSVAPDRSQAEFVPGGPNSQGVHGAGGRAAVPAGQGGEGADADGLRQYRLSLAREARRFKRYPERALLAGIGGTAEVRVEHDSGAMPVARLARSSGNEALDAAALTMMREAAPRTAIPETLRGRSFAVSLPVIFDASAE